MPDYIYQATNARGELIAGELTANNVSELIKILEAQGLDLRSLQASAIEGPAETMTAEPSSTSGFQSRIESALHRRTVLIPALTALADEMPRGGGRIELRKLTSRLQSCQNAVQILELKGAASWLPLLEGSTTSATDRMSHSIASAAILSEQQRRRRRVFAYPLLVLALAAVVLAVISVTVVPTFARMFQEFDLDLPAPTLVTVEISDELQHRPVRVLVVLGVVFCAAYQLLRLGLEHATPHIFSYFTNGNFARVQAMASFTGTLAELLANESPLPEALRLAGRGCQHRTLADIANHLANQLDAGGQLRDTLQGAHFFPVNVLLALQLGKHQTPSIPLLRTLSEIYAERSTRGSDWVTTAAAPLAIAAVGLVVGFVILSLFLPLIKLITSLGGY